PRGGAGAGAGGDARLEELLREAEGMLRGGMEADRSPSRNGGAGGPAGRGRDGVEPVDPGRSAWDRAVGAVLGAIRRSEVEKVVLARYRDVHLDADVDPAQALRFLRAENHRAHVYLVELDPGRVLLGAAPEILAELRGREFHATAVAGSAPRGATVEADADRARSLLASVKDRSEHRVTVEEMKAGLDGRMVRLAVPGTPRVLTLARIQHLETPIRGQAAPGADVLSLVRALHPTPAVCGRPTEVALGLLRASEPFRRGWYAGPVGWFDPAGDGDFVPALRSAVGGGRQWRLFAGAGIVEGSDPDAEWEETALKFEPAMKALLAGRVGEVGARATLASGESR
ncbi:MAG: isochorismate synthase, partial [Gemmatimonadales bacterium]